MDLAPKCTETTTEKHAIYRNPDAAAAAQSAELRRRSPPMVVLDCGGSAIAGRIGSDEQVKVGVFGPVVNLAARLQELTKLVRAPILIYRATVDALAGQLPLDEAVVRRIGSVRPPGIAAAAEVFALTPTREAAALSAEQRQSFDSAVGALEAGRWADAMRLLDELPASDGPAGFLKRAIKDYAGRPPIGWDGTLSLADAESHRIFAV